MPLLEGRFGDVPGHCGRGSAPGRGAEPRSPRLVSRSDEQDRLTNPEALIRDQREGEVAALACLTHAVRHRAVDDAPGAEAVITIAPLRGQTVDLVVRVPTPLSASGESHVGP